MTLVMLILFALLSLTLLGFVLLSAEQNVRMVEQMRGVLLTEDSAATDDFFPASQKISYVYTRFDNRTNEPVSTYTSMEDVYTYNDQVFLSRKIMSREQPEGYYGRMSYRVSDNGLYTTVTIVDMTQQLSVLRSVIYVAAIVMTLSVLMVMILIFFLSKWAMRPVERSIDRQKRFISDASHELKTPLAVISANADALEAEIGENRWLTNIKSESGTMNEMVLDLLDLAKLDETAGTLTMEEFDLSRTVMKKALEFESMAFEAGKRFEEKIEPNIRYRGSEPEIARLTAILIDNAIKHSNDGGLISISLNSDGAKRVLRVFNTGDGLRKADREKVFERFYRSDASRSRETGGYGLGLSIAKSIVDAHGGRISADCDEGKWVCFTAVL